jgi:aminopeptidase N
MPARERDRGRPTTDGPPGVPPSRRNPNRIRSLLGAFCMGNFQGFDRNDGAGYRLLTDFVIEIDPVNPQIASQLIQAMIRYKRFNEHRQALMKAELERLIQAEGCSDNTYEVLSRALGGVIQRPSTECGHHN